VAGAAQYPVAPPGTSAHEYGYAFDMVVSPLDALPDVAAYWRQLGGIWHPSDAVHFEYPGFREDLAAGIARPLSAGPPAILTKTADLLAPTGGFGLVAGLAEAAGVENPVFRAVSHPVEALQPYVEEFTNYMRSIGLLQ
jgi:hypothetical protein